VTDFKKRHRLSSRKVHFKRRPTVTEEQKRTWVAYVRELLATVPHERILNVDETSWKCFPNGIVTWADTGSDGVHVDIQGDPKECLTVIATVTAAGTKLPLFFLAKGKTQRWERAARGGHFPHM
jgi:hypothetical protein